MLYGSHTETSIHRNVESPSNTLFLVKGNNGFFTESEPGKGDYHHCGDMKPGQLIRFWGNKCQHYNEINETGSTRISFDLRIIPKSKFVERKETTVKSGLSFTLGSYYTLFQRTDE